jgi:hypothetical protein
MATLQGLPNLFSEAVAEVAQLQGVEKWRLAYSKALLANAMN